MAGGDGRGVSVACPRCGPVVVDPALAEIHANRRIGFLLYAFVCPACGDLAVGGRGEVIRDLVDAGAHEAELRSVDAPPLTLDEVIDLHRWLDADPAWPADPVAP